MHIVNRCSAEIRNDGTHKKERFSRQTTTCLLVFPASASSLPLNISQVVLLM